MTDNPDTWYCSTCRRQSDLPHGITVYFHRCTPPRTRRRPDPQATDDDEPERIAP